MDQTHYERVITHPDFKVRDFRRDLLSVAPLDVVSVFHAQTRDVEGPFVDFVKDPRVDAILELMSAVGLANIHGEVATNMNMLWQLANYVQGGKRTYVVAPGLARRFLVTELRGLEADDVRLPYPSIYVVIDPGLGFRTWNPATGWHRIVGAYVTQDDDGWRLLLCARGQEGLPTWDDALSSFNLHLNTTVDAAVEEMRESVLKCNQVVNGLPADAEDLVTRWVAVFKWLLNLVMFVTHADAADIEHVEANEAARALFERAQRAQGAKRARLHARLKDLPRRPRVVVGARVVVDDRWPRTAGQARTLLIHTLVAGHWQRYHVGTGRQETVWRFRQPFWRGAGEEGPTVHEVGDGGDHA